MVSCMRPPSRVSDSTRVAWSEETAVELVSRADVTRLVREGHIDHALVLAGLYYLELSEQR